jgi:hypothetical protein
MGIPEYVEPGKEYAIVISVKNSGDCCRECRIGFIISEDFFLTKMKVADNPIRSNFYIDIKIEGNEIMKYNLTLVPPVYNWKSAELIVYLERDMEGVCNIIPYHKSRIKNYPSGLKWKKQIKSKPHIIKWAFPFSQWSWILPFIPAFISFIFQFIMHFIKSRKQINK